MAHITITGTVLDPNGTIPTSGTVIFTLNDWMLDADCNIIVPKAETATLDASGNFTILLESTLDATPATRFYFVTFGGVIEGVTVQVTLGSIQIAATPATQDLCDLLAVGIINGGGGAGIPIVLGNNVPLQWRNTAGTAVDGLKLNASDQLELGAKWIVDADGTFRPMVDNAVDLGAPFERVRSGYFGTGIALSAGGNLNWNNDTILVRDQANNLALRNGATPQFFTVYNTYTDPANREAGNLGWIGNALSLYTASYGTGIVRPLNFGVGNALLWALHTDSLYPLATGVYDIGRATAEVRNIHLSGNLNWNNDTFLMREAAGQLAQRNGTNPQSLSIYSTYFGAGDYNRLRIAVQGIGMGLFSDRVSGSSSNAGELYLQASTADGWIIFLSKRLVVAGMPTSASGLPSGALWNNGGVVNIVP
jgi:hypothetical protein